MLHTPQKLRQEGGRVYQVAWSPDGALLATAPEKGGIRIHDPKTNQVLRLGIPKTRRSKKIQPWTLAWSPDGAFLASGWSDGQLHFHHIWEEGRADYALGLNRKQSPHQGGITHLAWHPTDHQRLLASDTTGTLLGWNLEREEDQLTIRSAILLLELEEPDSIGMAWSPDGTLLARSSRATGTQIFHDQETPIPFRTLPEGRPPIAWSSDSRFLSCASAESGMLHLWDRFDTQDPHHWQAHDSPLLSIAFSQLGHHLASQAAQGDLKLWDPFNKNALYQAQQPVAEFEDHLGTLAFLAFRPNHDQLLNTNALESPDILQLWGFARAELHPPMLTGRRSEGRSAPSSTGSSARPSTSSTVDLKQPLLFEGTAVLETTPSKRRSSLSAKTSSLSDQRAEKDYLGFKTYLDAVAAFLKDPQTHPPLTLSIEGEWGMGKSTFMHHLEQRLQETTWREHLTGTSRKEGSGPQSFWSRCRQAFRAFLEPPKHFTVRFNPWRHEKEEALWAAFAQECLFQVRRQRSWPRQWWGNLRVYLRKARWRQGTMGLLVRLGVSLLLLSTLSYVTATLWGARDALSQFLETEHGLASTWAEVTGIGGLLTLCLTLLLQIRDLLSNPIDAELRTFLKSGNSENRIAFIEQFHNDFDHIVQAYAGQRPIFAFIDDLDRCDVPQAARLMQGLNLLISDNPQLIFILAIDRDKIAAGLAHKYAELVPYLSHSARIDREPTEPENPNDRTHEVHLGHEFIEKFIQVPVRLPRPSPQQIAQYIEKLAGDSAPAESGPEAPTTTTPRSPASKTPSTSTADPRAKESSTEVTRAKDGGASTEKPSLTTPSAPRELAPPQETLRYSAGPDSPEVLEIVRMVAPVLDNNPRRIKQYFNIFRLKIYIFRSHLARTADTPGRVTLEQLGKLAAIGLRWPRLLDDLEEEPARLLQLERAARNPEDEAELDATLHLWHRDLRLRQLLTASPDGNLDPSPCFEGLDLDLLLKGAP